MRYTLLLFICFVTTTMFAQNNNNALLFAQQQVGGSARFVGAGGALGALGTDFSVLSTNPAGLAAYRKSEFVITPGLRLASADAQLLGEGNETFEDSKNNFNINNVGFVFHTHPLSRKWRAFNIGIGYNQVANFHHKTNYEGSISGSLANSYAEAAAGLTLEQLDDFSSALAYQTGAIYDFEEDLIYNTDFEFAPDAAVARTESISTEGSINELTLSFAGNYDHRLMIGATIGVPLLDWEYEQVYNETDSADDAVPFFNRLGQEHQISSSGVGINAKLGLIYRISQMVRLGGAVHTPTAYSITDEVETNFSYDFTDGPDSGLYGAASQASVEYRYRTPWRYLLSGAILIKKMGFISAEVEYTDFTQSNYDFERDNPGGAYTQQEVTFNNNIDNTLQDALTIRLGAEYAHKIWRVRAGYIINGSPFADNTTYSNNVLSIGAGVRLRRFYTDIAYRLTQIEDNYIPYSTARSAQPVVERNRQAQDILLTLGFRF